MTFELVPTARARRLAHDTVTELVGGFEVLRLGAWVSPVSEGVRAVLSLDAWKGGQFTLTPGIACAWVPLMWKQGDVFDWPRTARQTRRHLWLDHFVPDAPEVIEISRLTGEAELVRSAAQAAAHVSGVVDRWCRPLSEPESVLLEAQRQAANPHDVHDPRAQFVEAFTIAHLGDQEEGKRRLDPLIADERFDTDTADHLRAALTQTRSSF